MNAKRILSLIPGMLFMFCVYTGSILTYPFQRLIFDRFHGNDAGMAVAAAIGFVFWVRS